jgi:diaminopropionate ammonia-lyase
LFKRTLPYVNRKNCKSLPVPSKLSQYHPTSEQKTKMLANYFGVENIFIKDESFRFGLNAFKILGSSFAMAEFIAKHNKRDLPTLSYQDFISPITKHELGNFTFYTATDGNHEEV